MKTSELDVVVASSQIQHCASFLTDIPELKTGAERRRRLSCVADRLEEIAAKMRKAVEEDRG